MPVYDRGYTHWEPSGNRAWPAWWVVAKRGIAEPLKRRWLLILLLVGFIPAIVKGGIIFVKLKAGDVADLLAGSWTSIDPEGFLTFIEGQRFFVFVFLAIVGAGLVATDRRDNGLSLYFSRPLGLNSYVGGKALIVIFYYCLVTLFPVYALCIFSYWIAPEATGMDLLLLTPLRATVYCLLTGTSLSLVLLAMSSLGTRSIFVMVWWAIMVSGTETIGNVGGQLFGGAFEATNFLGNYHNAGALLFSSPARLNVSPWISLLIVCGWTAAAIWILRTKIRPVEVVS
jgi:hypothetical protein